jgi:membrane protein YqaA with SNARE-associated domain
MTLKKALISLVDPAVSMLGGCFGFYIGASLTSWSATAAMLRKANDSNVFLALAMGGMIDLPWFILKCACGTGVGSFIGYKISQKYITPRLNKQLL